MSYFEWFENHAKKHHALVEKLLKFKYTKEMMIEYFYFENMVKNEPDFCLLYQSQTKCHDIDHLNCYLCACPHFRFNDVGLRDEKGFTCKSECAITSRKRQWFTYEDVMHLDCSKCKIPHTKGFIEKNFDVDWKKIMKACWVTSPVL